MAIKWGSTTVTAVKWGSTTCTAVYWGSTKVFPVSIICTVTIPRTGGIRDAYIQVNNVVTVDGGYSANTKTAEVTDFTNQQTAIFSCSGRWILPIFSGLRDPSHPSGTGASFNGYGRLTFYFTEGTDATITCSIYE